jgi:hypothetical protein
VATFKVIDEANQYRIEIIGKFAGLSIQDVESCWKRALESRLQRAIVVDISRLDGYDRPGCLLLRKMHKHGTVIAASTPPALAYLEEITTSRRAAATTSLQEARPEEPRRTRTKGTKQSVRNWAAAGGE